MGILNAISLRLGLKDKFDRRSYSESGTLLITSIIVGIGAGLGAVVFLWLLEKVQEISLNPEGIFKSIAPYHIILVPAIGGLIAGPIIYFFAQEAKGHGVPSVMEAVAVKGGRIRPQVAFVKVIASAITIGTGGSAGSEGPIAQIGAGLGSTIGQIFHLSEDQVRTLVACGAGGGIAAIFHAPIGGAIFAMEVVLGRLHTMYFGVVVISSVVASVVAQIFQQSTTIFSVPSYELISPWELLFYAILGLLAAFGSLLFSRTLDIFETVSDRMRLPEYIKPMLGGLLLGVAGFLTYKIDGIPRIFDGGYSTISQTLFGELTLKVALVLLFLKMLATNLTLGSGGSGGIFAPTLFMGAMLGESFGQIIHTLYPQITAPTGAYALVGMAAFFSGAAHAPMTAILILFEMTGDYRIILPLMLATVISTIVSRLISRDSIYTIKLTRRGINLDKITDIDVMQGITVGEAMSKEVDTVLPTLSLKELSEKFAVTRHHSFPVVDQDGILVGVVNLRDLERAMISESIETKTVRDILMPEDLLITYPDEPMWKALKNMGSRGIQRLPVVENPESRKVVGLITGSDIIRAYNSAIAKRAQNQHKADALRLGKIDGINFNNLRVAPSSAVVGKRLSEIQFPPDCLVVSVRKGRRLEVAHGLTILQPGDEITVFTSEEHIPALKELITASSIKNATGKEFTYYKHMEVTVPAQSDCIGKQVREMGFPTNCLLVSIQRGGDLLIPHGYDTLHAGDIVTIYGKSDEISEASEMLCNVCG